MSFSDFLRRQLKENNWTYTQLGELIGVTHGAVGTWVRGTSLPDPRSLRALAELTNIDPIELFRMVGYLPPAEVTGKGREARPVLGRLMRKLDPLDDTLLELIDRQVSLVLVPYFKKLAERERERNDHAQRVPPRQDEEHSGGTGTD